MAAAQSTLLLLLAMLLALAAFVTAEEVELESEGSLSSSSSSSSATETDPVTTTEDLTPYREYEAVVFFLTTLTGEELLVHIASTIGAAQHKMQAAANGKYILLGCTSKGPNAEGVETRECSVGFKQLAEAETVLAAAVAGTYGHNVASAYMKIIPTTTTVAPTGTTTSGSATTTTTVSTTTQHTTTTLHPFLSSADRHAAMVSVVVAVAAALCASL